MPTLFDYQNAVIDEAKPILREYGGVLLALDPGLGKTPTSITLLRQFKKYMEYRTLVLCPASVLSVWQREAKIWAPELDVEVLTGPVKDRIARVLLSKAHVIVTNYDVLTKLEPGIMKRPFEIIIADEAHRLKSYNSSVNKAAAKIGEKAKFRIGLSGTPIPNGPIDGFGLYKFLQPRIFGWKVMDFRERYVIPHPKIPQAIRGYKNKDEFEEKFHRIAIVRKKEMVVDLPEKVISIVPVKMPPKVMKQYRDFEDELVLELENGESVAAPTPLTLLMRLAQFTGGFVEDKVNGISQQMHTAKLDALKDRLDDMLLNPEEKVVIFARFTSEIDAIRDMVAAHEKEYGKVCVIDGRTKMEDRPTQMEAFQNDPNTRVIIGQLQAMCEGVTLTKASNLVFYSLDYDAVHHDQAQDRIHRIGQTRTCNYYYLTGEGTVDEDIALALTKKKSLSDQILLRRGKKAKAG